jgi:hypothetical protein
VQSRGKDFDEVGGGRAIHLHRGICGTNDQNLASLLLSKCGIIINLPKVGLIEKADVRDIDARLSVQLDEFDEIICVGLSPITAGTSVSWRSTKITASRIMAVGLHETRSTPSVGVEGFDPIFDLDPISCLQGSFMGNELTPCWATQS